MSVFLVADSAFPVQDNIIRHFAENNLSEKHSRIIIIFIIIITE